MIYRLPYFAQLAVIQQMKPHECFFLGSLSKKAKRLVQRSIKKTFNVAVIDLNSKKIEVNSNSNTNLADGMGIALWAKCDRKTTTTNKFHENKWIKLEYNGIEMKCRLTFEHEKYEPHDLPMVWCDARQINLVPLALQKSISDVFDISDVIQLRMNFSRQGFTDIPSITQVDHIRETFQTEDVDEKRLDRLLKRVEVKHSIHFINSLHFKLNSPIFSFDHLFIREAQQLPKESFLNFSGKNAVFRDPRQVKNQDLIDFVNMWLNSTNTKLESMVIIRDDLYRFDREEVLEQFETIPWDPERRDGRFKYSENTQTAFYSNDLLDCTQQVDIQRKHDGLLATVVVTEKEFCFFVWHTPFALPGTNLPISIVNADKSVFYALGCIAF